MPSKQYGWNMLIQKGIFFKPKKTKAPLFNQCNYLTYNRNTCQIILFSQKAEKQTNIAKNGLDPQMLVADLRVGCNPSPLY